MKQEGLRGIHRGRKVVSLISEHSQREKILLIKEEKSQEKTEKNKKIWLSIERSLKA